MYAFPQVQLRQCGAVQCVMMCIAVQYSPGLFTLDCTVNCSAVQCSAVQCSAVQCNAVQCSDERAVRILEVFIQFPSSSLLP